MLKHILGTLLLSAFLVIPAQAALIINEVDSDTDNNNGTDPLEFIEIYETTGASVSLNGYALVLFNGNQAQNRAYLSFDLDGFSTDANGYFVLGAVPGAQFANPQNTIQNGGDAVALYLGNGADFPTGATGALPSATNLVDAVVYKTGTDVDADDMVSPFLVAGGVVDEFGRDGTAAAGAADSIGRLPNGSGNVRDTSTAWTFMQPTPGGPNSPVIPEPASVFLLTIAAAIFANRRQRG